MDHILQKYDTAIKEFSFFANHSLFLFIISIESWAEGETLPFGHQIGVGDFMGGLLGVAMFGYDDGDLDIYITNGEGFPNRLLQNDGEANFIDVATAGVNDRGRGHGVATADIGRGP